MPYTPITLLSELVAGQGDPADSEAANQLAAAVRQVKQFLGDFMAVSHDDTGRLKADVIDAAQIGARAINGTHLGDAIVQLENMASDSVDTPQLVDDAVTRDKIADRAVDNDQLEANSITTSKLSDNSVSNAKIVDNTITNAKLADVTVNADKIAGDSATNKLADRMGVGTLSVNRVVAAVVDPCLAVFRTSAATHVLAQIGGMLSATVDSTTTPPTLRFALGASTAGESATLIRQATGGGLTQSTWNVRGGLTRVIGDDTVIKVSGANTIQVVTDGIYLVIAAAMGNGCGLHQIVVEDDGTPSQRFLTGLTSYAGVGEQTLTFGFGIIDVDGHDVSNPLNLQLKHWCTLTDAAGQGRTGLTDDWLAAVIIIGLSGVSA